MNIYKNLIYLLLISGILYSCTPSTAPQQNKYLKVLSWNIWHGGDSEKYPTKGCNGVIDILKKSNADIITIIETYGAADKIADSLGYYHRLISNNLSIYSRYPIIKTYTFPDSISTFNFGGVMVNINGKLVRVFDTWIHYLPDATLVPTNLSESEILSWETGGTRDDETKKILSAIQPFLAEADSIPIIVAGDFNTHSHLDWTEATKNMYEHHGKVIKWPVSIMLEEAGFIDSFREINPDPTRVLGTTWRYGQGTNNHAYRIDYIYYKGKKLKAIDSETHNGLLGEKYLYKNENFFYASDHGFVETTFTIE